MRLYLAPIFFLILTSIQLSAQTKAEAVKKSFEFLSNLESENFEANRPMMAAAYADGNYAQKLSSAWNFQINRLGEYQMLKDLKYDRFRDYDIVYLNCAFEEEDYTIKLVFNKRLEITDVYFIPYPPLIPAGKLNITWIIAFLILWELAWKAMGMWKAAQNRQVAWFLAIFIIPTAGILPIVYTLFLSK